MIWFTLKDFLRAVTLLFQERNIFRCMYFLYRDKSKRYQERHSSWVLAGVPYQNVVGKLHRSVSSSTSFDRNSRNGSQVRDNDGNDEHVLYIGADSDSQWRLFF